MLLAMRRLILSAALLAVAGPAMPQTPQVAPENNGGYIIVPRTNAPPAHILPEPYVIQPPGGAPIQAPPQGQAPIFDQTPPGPKCQPQPGVPCPWIGGPIANPQ